MFIAFADRLCGQEDDRTVIGQRIGQTARHAGHGAGVDRHGQVRPVLFDRPDGQHRDQTVVVQRGKFALAVIGPIPFHAGTVRNIFFRLIKVIGPPVFRQPRYLHTNRSNYLF